MIYKIGLIIAGVLIASLFVTVARALQVIGIREIMAEEYRDRYEEELKSESELNKN